jgi:hypothetical protein
MGTVSAQLLQTTLGSSVTVGIGLQIRFISVYDTVTAQITATHHVTLGPLVSSGHGTSRHIWGQVFLKADFCDEFVQTPKKI